MRGLRKPLAFFLAVVMASGSFGSPNAQGKDLFRTLFRMKRPPAVEDPSVEELAQEIDWLEKHIDNYGSVVAKQPDIWGQARLTKHRQEYEDQMRAELNQFELYINGSLSRSDQSYLSSAFALSAAVSGGRQGFTRPRPENTVAVDPAKIDMSFMTSLAPAPAGAIVQYDDKGQVKTITGPTDPKDTVLFRSPPIRAGSGDFAQKQFADNAKIGLEPTIVLDQMSRYLQPYTNCGGSTRGTTRPTRPATR